MPQQPPTPLTGTDKHLSGLPYSQDLITSALFIQVIPTRKYVAAAAASVLFQNSMANDKLESECCFAKRQVQGDPFYGR